MDSRVIFIVNNMGEFLEKLEMYIDGKENIEDCYSGDVKRSKDVIRLFGADEDSEVLIYNWFAKGKVRKLAEIWIKGICVDWKMLYSEAKPHRINLPTYPFAEEHYWIPKMVISSGGITAKIKGVNLIHPLLQENTSDFSEQRFSSTFTGQELFMVDHTVKCQRVLPRVAYLEMARAAVEQTTGISKENNLGIRLRNVVWEGNIIVVDQPVRVHIGLYPIGIGEISYEVYGESKEYDAEPVILGQGSVILGALLEPPTVDLKELQTQEIQYGMDWKGVEAVYAGAGQVLVKLLPPSGISIKNDFILDPGIMGAAVQAAIGMVMNVDSSISSKRLSQLIALHEMEVYGGCASAMWAVIRYSEGSKKGDKVQKFDCDLCDEHGSVCVRIKGLAIELIGEGELRDDNLKEIEIPMRKDLEASTEVDVKTLLSASVEYLKALIAEITKIPVNKLDSEVPFEEFGLDSIMISGFNRKIEQWIGRLDATLFFKYNNIHSLGAYFVDTYPHAVSSLVSKKTISVQTQASQSNAYKIKNSSLISIRQSSQSQKGGRLERVNNCENIDIAVIGVAGRYPQSMTLKQLWRNLFEGKDCIEEIPVSRWSLDGFFEPNRDKAIEKGLSYSKWGGFLQDFDHFDPLFFNIAPKDANGIDPQGRLFLEVVWECMENAGYTRKSLEKYGHENKIGVFVGATYNNYQLYMAEAAQRANKNMYSVNSQMFSTANRVSYIMNFTGPSLTLDTACSSSLYAIHLACDSIRNGQSRMAIAGGVNLNLHPSKYITLSQAQFSASDGRCRAFCEGGTGYVPAEGVGAVLLKPLQDAINDEDIIYGVIKGSTINHGGRTNGYTVPSPVSQSLAIEGALRQCLINPRTISCIEAHGTGTALGDPIEITGLTDAFRKYTKDTGFCSISSVKSNIGHAEAAAGIVQLTKVLLQFKHQTLVKNVMHGKGLNPNIDFNQTPFVVQAKTEHWERPIIDGKEVPRRAGISSFGAGGSIAHMVVEEYIPRSMDCHHVKITTENPAVIVLSAKNEERLNEQVKNLLATIEEEQFSDTELANVAYTLQVGREAMEERLGIVVGSIQELKNKLKEFMKGQDKSEKFYRGQVKWNKETLGVFADEELQEAIEKWIQRGKYERIVELWVKGLTFDWSRIYSEFRPQRISLPTYPFARQRYWIPEFCEKENSENHNSVAGGLGSEILSYENRNSEDGEKVERIIRVWQKVLGIERFNLDESFFDLGGDSIKTIQAVTLLTADDFKITTDDIYSHQTVESLASHISQSANLFASRIARLRRLSAEPDLSDEIQAKLVEYKDANKKYSIINMSEKGLYENVMLTGATGYLGSHLLQSLLEYTPYTLHVLIRGKEIRDCEQRLEHTFDSYFGVGEYSKYACRIQIVKGDLTQDQFGLSSSKYQELAEIIDSIINPAANVKHNDHYDESHEINVKGVARLVNFAKCCKKKDLHHISTSYVAGGNFPGRETVLYTEYDGDMGQKLQNVYLRTKLQAENVIEEARKTGLKCNIYRVGNLVFESETGKFQKNIGDNAFYNLVKSYLNTGFMPNTTRKSIDFAFVDKVSSAITLLFDKKSLVNETFHLYNPYRISLGELRQLFNNAGFAIEALPHLEFDNNSNETIQSSLQNVWVNSLLTADDDFTDVIQVNDKTAMILRELGLNWDAPNEDHIKKMIEYCRTVNFISQYD